MRENKESVEEKKDVVPANPAAVDRPNEFSLDQIVRDMGSMHRALRNSMRGFFGPDPFFDRFDEYFDGLHDRMRRYFDEHTYVPKVEFYGAEGGYGIRIDMPGVKREDITAELEGRVLTLKASRAIEQDIDGKKETYRQPIEAKVLLPHTIDAASITSTYDNGVLDMTMKTVAPTRIPIAIGK